MTAWVGVASGEHVAAAVDGGFCQLAHGKEAPLRRMSPGDHIVYYTPRETEGAGEVVHPFSIWRREDLVVATPQQGQRDVDVAQQLFIVGGVALGELAVLAIEGGLPFGAEPRHEVMLENAGPVSLMRRVAQVRRG